jgi:hypothetical protein
MKEILIGNVIGRANGRFILDTRILLKCAIKK